MMKQYTLIFSLFMGIYCLGSITSASAEPPAKPLTSQEILPLLKEALQSKISLSGDFDVQLNNPRLTIPQPAQTNPITIEIIAVDESHLTFKAVGRFASSSNEPVKNIPLEGKILPLTDIPVLTRAITPGEEILEADLTWQKIPSQRLSQSFLIRKEDLIGKTPVSKVLQPAQPLYRSDLKFPIIIKKGDTVTVIYRSPGLLLTNQSQAQSDGAKGDTLRFVPLNSKKEIQAKVVGPNQAEIRPLFIDDSLDTPATE